MRKRERAKKFHKKAKKIQREH